MVNRATPNLPSRDLAATCAFYTRVGFGQEYRDAGWLILTRDGVTLEFFRSPISTRQQVPSVAAFAWTMPMPSATRAIERVVADPVRRWLADYGATSM